MSRKKLAFVVGGAAAVFNAMSVSFFAAWQPADEKAALTMAVVGAVNVGLTTLAGFLQASE